MSDSHMGSKLDTANDDYRSATGTQEGSHAGGRSSVATKKRKSCGSYLKRFDEFCMKPIFIRKYDAAKARMAEDFVYDYVE